MDTPTKREDIGEFLNQHGLFGIMVEVGSAWGKFAREILAHWNGKHLILVDPWQRQDPNVYKESTNDTAPFDGWFARCFDCAQEDVRKRVSLLRMLSIDAAHIITAESLDCVYLDGNHAYGAVLDDLTVWWPKIKSGGLLGGHDFYNDCSDGHFCEVERAVKAWAGSLPFSITDCSSWWIRKP